MAYKITQKRDECIGCGACVAVCPENWVIASDGKAKPKKDKIAELGSNKEAADSCPVKCIEIKEV